MKRLIVGFVVLATFVAYIAVADPDGLYDTVAALATSVINAQATADDAHTRIDTEFPEGTSSTDVMTCAAEPGKTHIRENATPTSSQFCWVSDATAGECVCVTGTATP